MRKRVRLGCWQQLLTLLGIDSHTSREWTKIYNDFQGSWTRNYYINLDQNENVSADVEPVNERQDVTARPENVVFVPERPSFTMAPPPSARSVSTTKRRRNSVAPPTAAPSQSVGPFKMRRISQTAPSPSIKRRNSLAPPSSPSVSTIKRRNSLAPPSSPTVNHIKRRNSVEMSPAAAASAQSSARDLETNHNGDLLLSPIKRSDSAIPPFEIIDCDEFKSPERRCDSMASDPWMKPIEFISPLAATPTFIKQDSVKSDVVKQRNESVSPCIQSRNSTVSKSKSSQRKQQQKRKSVVKHVTGSGDELDDEMSLSTWKEYSEQRKALGTTKPLASTEKGLPKMPKPIKVEPLGKRKRGRPSREEKAKRLMEEEQALKMMQQASASGNEPPVKKAAPDWLKQEPDQNVEPQNRRKKPTKKQQHQKTSTQPTISLPPHKQSKPPKQKPTAKPRSQSTSSVSDQEGADNVVQPAILDEDGTIPAAHMPADAIDLKSSPGDREEDEQDKAVEAKKKNAVKPKSKSTDRLAFKRIAVSLSSDDDEQQIIPQQTELVLNDLESAEQLLDKAMDLSHPVGGVAGNKDALDMDIDLDLLVRDESVAEQMALIDTQPVSMSFDRCLAAIDAMPPIEPSGDQCLETVSPQRAASSNDQPLNHTNEFFENLSSRSAVNVNADKSNLLWPFMDEDEVLDYEFDYDVLTLVVDSDELEDEGATSQINVPKVQVVEESSPEAVVQPKPIDKEESSPKAEVQPKPNDKNKVPKVDNLKSFRIPKINPEVLQAQPAVMHSLYMQEETEQKRVDVKPALNEELQKRREDARAARRPKETVPRFAPPFRPAPSEDFSQQMLHLPPPLFGPEDLGPIFVPPSEESNFRHSHEPVEAIVPTSGPLINREFLPEVPPQRHHLAGASQYVPQNLATSQRNACLAEVAGPKHWMMEVFGVKCLKYVEGKCMAAYCDHAMSPLGEVERRLLRMPEETLVRTYRQALRSSYIFERYYKCFANIFERRKLDKHLLQMLANSRLYRNMTVDIVDHVFRALKRAGMEREATRCLMTDLWMPDKAHKFSELTLAILKLLEKANWPDYIDQLVELHETYKFLLSDEFMIRIMKWADVTKNEPLQKKAMMMLLADMPKYGRSLTLMSLVDRFSNPEPQPAAGPVPTLPLRSPARQQPSPAFSNWNHNPNPNQVRLPGAGSTPSLVGRPAASGQWIWNHNPNLNPNLVPQNERLPGADFGPSLLRGSPTPLRNHTQNSNPLRLSGTGPSPLAGQQQEHQQQHQQQQHPTASNWRGQADNFNEFGNYPAGFQ